MKRRVLGCGLGAILLVSAAASARQPVRSSDGGREPRAIHVSACAEQLERQIRSEHPHTDAVEVSGGTLSDWAWSRSESAVAGSGRMLRGKTWDEFDFVCLVDDRSERVTALEWSGPLNGGKPVRPGAARPMRLLAPLALEEAPARACVEAVGAAIRRDHPRSGQLRIETAALRQWRRPANAIGVRGEGVFSGRRGQPHPFEFGCVWSERGVVGEVFYELQ